MMKLSKLLLLTLGALLLTNVTYASRTKSDLLPSKEKEIIKLLHEKLTLVDELLTEAQIYKAEKDPLIEKDFFGKKGCFVTKAVENNAYLQTGSSSSVITRRENRSAILGSTQEQKFKQRLDSPRSEPYRKIDSRDIFGIEMQRVYDIDTAFSSNMNYIYLLGYEMENETDFKRGIPKEALVKTIDTHVAKEIQPLTTRLLKTYAEVVQTLSDNNIERPLRGMIKKDTLERWVVHARMFAFGKYIKKDENFKKNRYQYSLALQHAFEDLSHRKAIKVTPIPTYYDKKLNKNLKCLETSAYIKYKGRICLNPIDTDKDVYFDYGTFETREYNFILQNQERIQSLLTLDNKLKKASREYIKLILSQLSQKESKQKGFLNSSNKISLDGGL